MTVKLTSVMSRCVVFLMTALMAQCVPLDFTTSRYNEETKLHDNRSLLFSIYADRHKAPEIFDIQKLQPEISSTKNERSVTVGRISRGPRNEKFYSEEVLKNFRNFTFENDTLADSNNPTLEDDDIESRKFSNSKKSELYSNFERHNLKNATKNKPYQLDTTKHSTNTRNSSQYSNFVTNSIRHAQTLHPVSKKSTVSPNKSQNFEQKKNTSKTTGVFQIKLPKPTGSTHPAKFMTITRKPIVITLTKVPSNYYKPNKVTRPTIKTTRTPGWISKIKSTTPIPTSSTKNNVFGWPNSKIKNKNDLNRYKNYTDLNLSSTGSSKKPSSNMKKKRPVSNSTPPNRKKPSRVKYVPKPGHKPTIEEIKQNWYESGVPYPNPMPEISSNTPTFAIPPPEAPIEEDLDSVQVDAAGDNALSNVISNFNLDMRPAVSNVKDTLGSAASGCPTVHISSSVLSPQQRQECSDLNLVINSHFHQNTASDRLPSIDTYQAGASEDDIPVEAGEGSAGELGQADPGLGQVDPGLAQADPGVGLADPGAIQADSAGGSPGGTGGNGASGGSGGNGGNGGDSNNGLGWPDLKGMLDAMDWIGNKLGYVLRFLGNPYLYLIPATLFFLLGFFLKIALFPWWVPLLFLFLGIKSKQKPNIVHHKHVHKPVHHPDGWFWNQHTKTWENVQDYLHTRRISNDNLNHIPKAIDQFGKKYGLQTVPHKKIRSLHFEPIERSGNQLMEIKKSSDDLILDTRTPPRIRAQTKKKDKDEHMEYSHAGVAIPVDEDSIKLEETTKKLNFYKLQRPTTNSGLSTWILLSGESSSTTPKAMNVSDTEDMKVIEVSGTKIVKPVFKKRTTTSRPTTSATTKIKGSTEASTKRSKPTPLLKIKASTLNNAKRKNDTKTIGTSIKEVTEHPTEKNKVTLFSRLPTIKTTPLASESSNIETSTLKNGDKSSTAISPTTSKDTATDSKDLALEAKEGETNITEAPTNNKNKKRNKTKKNKNKNRRKKPQDKTSNSTVAKVQKSKKQVKEKPIGTQIYNYLSREMMPTLGVGLVGLMVTAGLASYFLYPFGAARRIYEVDRKDKEGSYHYNDIYSGGIAEEEALGKVIAGMPLDKLQSSMFNIPTTRKPVTQQQNSYYPQQQTYANHQMHQKHHMQHSTKHYHNSPKYNNGMHQNNENGIHQKKQNGMVQGTVESVPLGPTKDSYHVNSYNKDSYQLVDYKNNEVTSNKDTEVSMDQKFVVGNAPKGSIEEITPAAVPEHGPRMLKLRRRRREIDDMENDIYNDKEIVETFTEINNADEEITTIKNGINLPTTDLPIITTTKNTTDAFENKVQSVVDLIKDIFHMKINLGLELVKNTTRSISNYIEKVQSRLDTHYRNSQKLL